MYKAKYKAGLAPSFQLIMNDIVTYTSCQQGDRDVCSYSSTILDNAYSIYHGCNILTNPIALMEVDKSLIKSTSY